MAQNLHRHVIKENIASTFAKANMTIDDIDAIAVTTRPGLSMSLLVGLRYAKHLCRKYSKPLIPIHHMQAHALTARVEHKIDYPFLCLLASGGHCLLTFVKSTTEFMILGEAIDDAPGECFDKVARELQLKNLPQFAKCTGGAAIELAARAAVNPNRYEFPLPLARDRNCQFSFSGLKSFAHRTIGDLRSKENLHPDQTITHYADFCAGFLRTITKVIVRRTQRAMSFCDREQLWGDAAARRLVFSGGVACNDFIYTALQQLCQPLDYDLFRPSRQFCTDNGIMIAWNGVERWQFEKEKYLDVDLDTIRVEPKEPLGVNFVKQLASANIQCDWARIPNLRLNTVSS